MMRLSPQPPSPLKSSWVFGVTMVLLAVGGVGWYFLFSRNSQYISRMAPRASPTIYPSTETQQFLSPDGTKKLSFRIEPTSDPYLKTYFVVISDGDKHYQVYSEEFGKSRFLLSPSKENWSHDATYVFLEISAPDAIEPLIFKTGGTTFSNGKMYIDAGELLHEQTGYYVNKTIRWISDTQLELSVLKELILQPFNYIFDVEKETFTKQINS